MHVFSGRSLSERIEYSRHHFRVPNWCSGCSPRHSTHKTCGRKKPLLSAVTAIISQLWKRGKGQIDRGIFHASLGIALAVNDKRVRRVDERASKTENGFASSSPGPSVPPHPERASRRAQQYCIAGIMWAWRDVRTGIVPECRLARSVQPQLQPLGITRRACERWR